MKWKNLTGIGIQDTPGTMRGKPHTCPWRRMGPMHY